MGIPRGDYAYLLGKQHNQPLRKKDNPEGRTQLSILRYIRSLGYVCGKTKTVGIARKGTFWVDKYLFLGFPDITAFCPHLVFIEVKSPTGVQSAHQKFFEEYCRRANILYILARSLDDVSAIIK